MIRDASLFLAIRYLKPKRTFLSVISFLSVIGPVLGVAVLIIVLSVMAGFNRDIREKILGMQAHIQLRGSFGVPISDPNPVLAVLRDKNIHASPVVDGPVLIQLQRRVLAKYIKGIVPELEKYVTDIHKSVIEGKYDIGENEVLIGNEFARQCNLSIGDKFIIHSPEKLNRMVKFADDGTIVKEEVVEVYVPEEVVVGGIYSLGMYEYDSSIIVMQLDKADEIFGLSWGAATSIQLRTDDPFNLTPVTDYILNEQVFNGLVAITWQQANQKLFGALRVEKNLMFFLLIFIMIVAAFGIATTLITVVIQKTREIGVLKALGATPVTILRIFVLQGAFVGILGTAAGTLLGLVSVHYRNAIAAVLAKIMGTEIFPRDLYHLSQIPALVQVSDVVIIVVSALIICILGALVPAIYAATMTPASALRNEM